jgi:4,5:9,10-diseco-3-hydroxy-5,9,17-trioxoandrosta-1(10),2-diene-4-oate hydrolase
MATELKSKVEDRYVTVDGLKTRYIEQGEGPAVILMHGASLGSSADVFLRTLGPLAKAGFRAIAFDQPGFGLTDNPTDNSAGYRRKMMPKFIEALGLKKVALIAHSQSGNPAVQLALQEPERYAAVVVLGTGSLLPPLEDKKTQGADREAVVQQRLERRMAQSEPTVDDTRKLLEANLFHHELITTEELTLRHSRSIGKNFQSFVARSEGAEEGNKQAKPAGTPMWQRLVEVKVPLLLIFGRNDRANAFERATLLKETYPQLDLHIVDDCKHLVPWDAADKMIELAVPVLKKSF